MTDTNDKPTSARARAETGATWLMTECSTNSPPAAAILCAGSVLVDAALAIADELAALRGVLAAGRDGETAREADSVTVSRDDFCAKALRWHRLCSERRDARATGQAWLDALDALITYDAATRAREDGRDG